MVWSVSSTLQIQNSLSVKHLWFLVGVSLRSILLHTEEDFFTFFERKKQTQEKGQKRGKKISQKSRVKKGGTPKTNKKKTTDDLLERVALVRSIDRSIDRLLPPPSTEYTAIVKSPNLGIFFFLTRPCENARGVRVERATVVLWCLFSK